MARQTSNITPERLLDDDGKDRTALVAYADGGLAHPVKSTKVIIGTLYNILRKYPEAAEELDFMIYRHLMGLRDNSTIYGGAKTPKEIKEFFIRENKAWATKKWLKL